MIGCHPLIRRRLPCCCPSARYELRIEDRLVALTLGAEEERRLSEDRCWLYAVRGSQCQCLWAADKWWISLVAVYAVGGSQCQCLWVAGKWWISCLQCMLWGAASASVCGLRASGG